MCKKHNNACKALENLVKYTQGRFENCGKIIKFTKNI